jgi:hypothetical protein
MPETPENEEFAELDSDHPALKALQAERKLNRELRGALALSAIVGKYPDLGLSPEDFEGLTPDKYEARAARLASLRQAAATPPPAPAPALTPEPEQQVELSETEKAFARMSQPLSATPPAAEKKLSLNEAQTLFKRDRAEFERLRAAGRIELGVKAVDRGGSVIFEAN